VTQCLITEERILGDTGAKPSKLAVVEILEGCRRALFDHLVLSFVRKAKKIITLPFMMSGKPVGIVNVYCPNINVMTYVWSVPVLWFCESKTATLPSLQNSQWTLNVSAVLIVFHYLQPTFAGLPNYQSYIKFSSNTIHQVLFR